MNEKLNALRKAIKEVRESITADTIEEYITILSVNYDDAVNQAWIFKSSKKTESKKREREKN